MKKLLLTILTFALACCCLLFGGCSNGIEGTYKFKSMKYEQGGMSLNLEVGEEFMGMITLSEDFVVITLAEDGVATAIINAGETETSTGTWFKNDDGKVSITFDEETQTCECDGTTLYFEMEGMKLTLEK